MNAIIVEEAENEIERAFNYYEQRQPGLGGELLDEYRRGLERVPRHPNAWQPLDSTYRRCRLHRFPYGIVYRADAATDQVVIVAFMHLSQMPDSWRDRDH